MKKLGVIGGLGPMATVYFLQRVTEMTAAQTDQEHIQTLLVSDPTIPDRTQYILGNSTASPLPAMLAAADQLRLMGAEVLAIPCVTAHHFWSELEAGSGLPMINVITEAAEYCKSHGAQNVGILATDGTLHSRVLQGCLESYGMTCTLPNEVEQRQVMEIIYRQIKAGEPVAIEDFLAIGRSLVKRGADVLLLGCTELSLIKRDFTLEAGYLDLLDVLAKGAVERCARLRPEYEELITR